MPRFPAALLTLALGCGAALTGPAAAQATPPDSGPAALQRQFAAAATEFGVPRSVLLALAYQESRWESHQGRPSTTGNYGVFGLTDADTPPTHTLDEAARLIHRRPEELREESAQNIRGAAALLTSYQKALGAPTDGGSAGWYRAVARYGQAGVTGTRAETAGRVFAERVYRTIRTGAARTTPEGQRVVLPAEPGLRLEGPTPGAGPDTGPAPETGAAPGGGAATGDGASDPTAAAPAPAECPPELGCDVTPAAYALTDPHDPTSFGNYSKADRPQDGEQIRYVVIHDTEGDYQSAVSAFQDPADQASAHYLVRAGDGHVTQLVPTRDIAWHAANKTINMHSIGIEHEGFALPKTKPTWYSEQLYQSSAELVRYLAARFGIPLDREHVFGHDEVPGPTQQAISGMHWDPGTFWDWAHYLELLHAPIDPGLDRPPLPGETVTIAPPFTADNEPAVAGVAARPENFVYLRTGPAADAPLLNGGGTDASDWTDKAVTGVRYVVADQRGDWTAIWYGGKEAWFADPGGSTARTDRQGDHPQQLVTPRPGAASVPVYGRAYPEAAAYAPYPAISPIAVVPLTATIPAGQAYVSVDDAPQPAQFYYDQNINGDAPNDRTLVVGQEKYYAIRFNHRLAFVKAADVRPIAAQGASDW
ncbi:N-acetylmuramoyl-L-alanine amidase [Kitasatospora sp. NBC_01287]|uniref:N-acetylmuramoyl-L-alanine amidase n=1 Tax=Kitasatospora sp. NBC_01287 TaxID=2903573 RepID=UPI002252D0E3|nr:N-acetylmuramoyl-L-alanine amidase [Kitasatospora sp. NBC_01287]MCX4744105.1 N-acetylmuramoyl-L-alanine amidase [Kitasatospora sp. NBC_01287]